MKNINTYLNEQLNNRILEKLKVSKNNYDLILDIVPDEWYDQDDRICLHFRNFSALLMYALEMEDQISDGKYENARPEDHWEWTKRSFFTVDGNEFYTAASPYRIPNKKYNLNKSVKTIKDVLLNGYKPAGDSMYLYDYGRMGKCLTTNELKNIIKLIPGGFVEKLYIPPYIGTITELFADALRKNPKCKYKELKTGLQRYQKDAFVESPQLDDEVFFERFKNTEYSFNEFKADYDSMIKTINTPN